MTKRKAITPAMKIDAILWRFKVYCSWCDEQIHVGHPIEWDHVHALVHGGEHCFTNLRPIHADPCHKEKTKADIQANAKVKRIIADKPSRRPMKSSGRKIPSRPWPKRA